MFDIHDSSLRLQPAKPSHYKLSPVVQPQWRLPDLWHRAADDELEALRQRLCESYGVRHCLLLDRARSGLYLLCRAFGLDDEWILTSVMHRPSAIVLSNHASRLAFADVNEDMTIDPASVERLLTDRTCAILATHTYGRAADIIALRKLADKHGLALIENAVHMAGKSQVQGRTLGSWGDASIVSFNVDKPLGGILGGALLTNRDDIWRAVNTQQLGGPNTKEMRERIRTSFTAYRLKPLMLRLPAGRQHRGTADGLAEIESVGISIYERYTPRDIHPRQARVALSCMDREERSVVHRTSNAERLNGQLTHDDRYGLPQSTLERPHTYTYYPLLVRKGQRLELGEHLANAGIESKWRLAPLHTQTGFTEVRRDDLTRSEKLWSQHLLLPAGPSITSAQIDYLAKTLLSWKG
ncbi:DegT/DnrJ/EryC1/StrS family aminotransferase [Dyella sp.]|uniref:DegT/DnrJ/EryC1/StrS family aminotransferase n=1 Tax=Dyella sp. TaxID=1869338 RepID=UPI002D79AAB7|nr:DegT/DnrJ/EryC1/StrS family aminotransferase [Dyella sp.]HET7333272.1 DegT/DnrJ/EryC1/StrS family aminotransferase [Dyella sp.]